MPENTPTPPWLAQGEPILLSPEMRKVAYASRRFPQPVESLTLNEAWQQVREATFKYHIDDGKSDAELREAALRMMERLHRKDALPEPDAPVDTLLLVLGFYNSRLGEAMVEYLLVRYGLIQALDIWLAAQRVQVLQDWDVAGRSYRDYFSCNAANTQISGYNLVEYGQTGARLRAHLAAASDEDWRTCAQRIEAALPGLPPDRQPINAMLLPEWPELSNALALRLGAEKEPPQSLYWLQLTATEPEALARLSALRPGESYMHLWGQPEMVATLVQERGLAAVPLLAQEAEHKAAGEALAAIGTPEAVMALAKVATSSKDAVLRLALAVKRWPQAALVAMARGLAAGGKDAPLFAAHLTGLVNAHRDDLDTLRPWLDTAAQGKIDQVLATLDAPIEVAESGELPDVLRAPPWHAKPKKKTAAAALALEPLPLVPVEQWEPGAKETALKLGQYLLDAIEHAADPANIEHLLNGLAFDKTATDAARAALKAGDTQALIALWCKAQDDRAAAKRYGVYFRPEFIRALPPAMAVPFWNAAVKVAPDCIYYADFLMASFGLPALPGLQALMHAKPTEGMPLALYYGAVELAPTAARAFCKLKKARDAGRTWLLKYPEHAACALLAPALGKPGEARDCASAALRLLNAHGHAELLQAVAARYDHPDVLAGLQAVLAESPLDRFPAKQAKLPLWWQPHLWPRPLLRSGKTLPADVLDHLGQMLTFPANEEIYPGLTDVKAACAPDSLAEFAWGCFSAWLANGAVAKDNWALTALGVFGNDDTARQLTPLIRAWPGESAHARAVTGLDVLANIGTDIALMQLHGIAQKLKFKGLQDKAREKINAIAEARGLTTEELEDRLAPDLGLDARGTLRLDFGPRAFTVGFDESLKPYVRELDADGQPGTRLTDLPKPKKTDAAELAKAAVDRFKRLKKDARTIAAQQVLRLETAMCTRRRWTPELFRLFLLEHPLLRHLVQRLVWGVYSVADGGNSGGQLQACFRVAEDGSLTTAGDDPFTLPEGDTIRIGIPHALELPAADAAAFGQLFTDYELLPPFSQLGRETYSLSEAEKAADALHRWKGRKVPTGRILGLTNKGWRRGDAQDAGCILWFLKPLGGQRVIELNLDPGIFVGGVNEEPEQTLDDLQTGPRERWGSLQTPEPFSTLDAIAASELIRDMEALCAAVG